MDGIRCINPYTETTNVVGTENEDVVDGSVDIFEQSLQFIKILLRAFGNTGSEETGCKQ
jgi:hypothetical protein